MDSRRVLRPMARTAGNKETVKGLSWKLLYGNYRKTIGMDAWDEAVTDVGGPDVVAMDAMDDVPMQPFNEMLWAIDRKVGRGTGSEIDKVAQESVKGWANFNKNLVKQLHGDPHKMMEVFVEEVHPFFLNDPNASRIDATMDASKDSDGGVRITLPNGLGTRFKVGLLRGFVALTGATAEIHQEDDAGDTYTVTWTLPEGKRGSKAALFANAVRAPFLTATIVPVLVGWAVAWLGGHFDPAMALDWGWLALTLAAVTFFHLGTNAMNDYFDHRSGADEANYTPTPFSGGSRVIQRGLMDPERVKRLAWTMYGTGTVLGVAMVTLLTLFADVGAWRLGLFGVAGFLVGYLYTAPPFQLVHRGFGELAVALGFGPIIVLGTWAVFSLDFAPASWTVPLVASIPVALLVAAILYVNEFPDRAGDAAAGKRTLVVRLQPRAAVWLFNVIVLAAYAAVAGAVLLDVLPMWTLLALLTLPLAVWTLRKVGQDHGHAYKLIPANAATILGLHLGTGVLLVVGLVIGAMGQ